MKGYNIILPLILSVIAAGCSKETQDNQKKELKPIEFSCTYNDAEVKSLQFNSASRSIRVGVTLNNQDIYWSMVSDADWCQVVEETHKGDGGFTLNILANGEYSDRESANITFVSGQYKCLAIQVSQTGNIFIVNKLFSVSSKTSGTEELEVSVMDGVEWEIVGNDWMSAAKVGTPVSENGVTKTKVSVSWNANESAARFGSIGFRRADLTEPDSQFSVFQFGNEMTYDNEGNIVLPAQDCPSVKITIPASGVSAVTLPEWITYSVERNENNTDTYSFVVSDNPSDTRTVRRPQITFDVADKDADVVLPSIKQEYYTVNGIMSADGLKLFAQTVNEGGDTSEWQKDGKVILLNNIDMSSMSGEWISAGTTAHPFTGVFDGRYRKILNLKASSPLFGICEGASISNVVIDESSAFSTSGEYMTECLVAALAGSLTDCKVSECNNYANVTMSASSLNASTSAFVGGLAGRSQGSTIISNSHNYGYVNVTDACKTASGQGQFHIGGLTGMNGGSIDKCSNNGAVSDAAVSYNHYLGGVTGSNAGTVKDSKNCGRVTTSSLRLVDNTNDASRYISMGGIVGWNMTDGAISGCTNDASLVSGSDVKIQRIGGVAGYLEGAQLSGNTNTENGKCDINGATTDQRGVRQLSLGGLYGEFVCDAVLDLSNEGEVSAGVLNVSEYENNTNFTTVFVGGLIGRGCVSSNLTVKHPQWKSTITLNVKNKEYGSFALGVGAVVGSAGVFGDKPSGGHLTVEDAATEGYITLTASKNNALKHKYSGLGGVVGFVSIGGATLLRCTNGTNITQSQDCAKSNGYAQHAGGIAGVIMGGDSEIRDCHNTGEIDNEHYNNNPWNVSGQQCGSAAGIIGAYGYNNSYNGSLVISGCTNSASVKSYRGMAGGIAGYLRNAEISDCCNTGTMANGTRAYVGGIIGIADKTSITNCTATCKVSGTSAGSEIFSGGGVAGILWTGSSCKESSFFGDVISQTEKPKSGETAGSIAGSTASGTTINGCKAGGTVRGNAVTGSNYSSFIAGDSNATISSCTYWDGK